MVKILLDIMSSLQEYINDFLIIKRNFKMIILSFFTTLMLLNCNNKNSFLESKNNDKWWTESDRELIISELNRTTNELHNEIKDLTIEQWNFREDATRWSIAEIVEHLEIQNLLHYREISVISFIPQHQEFREITKGKDEYFTKYATDTIKGQAQWFLEPMGRYKDKQVSETAFYKARAELIKVVSDTDIDLRKQFTFRTSVLNKELKDIKIGQVRDLHQLLLTGIAHTDRHLAQLKKIKSHLDFANYNH